HVGKVGRERVTGWLSKLAFTIATIPARTSSDSTGQASTTRAKSGFKGAEPGQGWGKRPLMIPNALRPLNVASTRSRFAKPLCSERGLGGSNPPSALAFLAGCANSSKSKRLSPETRLRDGILVHDSCTGSVSRAQGSLIPTDPRSRRPSLVLPSPRRVASLLP